MRIKDITALVTSTIIPQPNVQYHLYSLPSFDENQTREELYGCEIQSNKYNVPDKCILFNKLNVRFRRVWRINNKNINKICSTEFLPLIVDENKVDYNYCYYLLVSDYITNYLCNQNTNTSGSHKRIDPIDFLNIELPFLPTLEEQKRIGWIFSAIDKKISLNRAINQNLEALAKQLYDYWFVQFDFPDENGRPYKSSGGKMKKDKRINHNIPENWTVRTVQEIENHIVTGKTPSTTDATNFGGDIPFITIDDIRKSVFVYATERTLTIKGANTQANKYLPKGSLCCSCIGTTGIIGFVGKKGQTNQQINSIIFNVEENKEFVYFALKLHFQFAKAKTGNILPNMNKDEFANILIVYPPKDVLEKFHNIAKDIFSVWENNVMELNELIKQRNELLPLLMNGQVLVNSDLCTVK